MAGPFEYEIHREIVPHHFKYNDRENCKRALKSLGKEELKTLLDENENVEIVDEFSKEKYTFTLDDIKEIITEINSK